MSTFSDLLAEQKKKRAESVESSTVEVAIGDQLVQLKFYEMSGPDWANITASCPARPEALVDIRFGYNVHKAATRAAELSGVRLDGDDEVKLVVTKDEKSGRYLVNEWAELMSLLSGSDFEAVCDAIFTLNQWNPQMRTERLKKASTAASTVKRDSLENSESPSSASAAGNRASRRSTSTTKKATSATPSPRRKPSGTQNK